MATNTRGTGTGRTRRSTKEREDQDSSIGSTGVIVGAAMAGVAAGIVANVGRKLFVQFGAGGTGDWVEMLTNEHRLALGIFEKIEATDDSQTAQRIALLKKLKFALSKHAFQEENVIYPALRQANQRADADHLGDEHGYVKTYLYELENMPKDSPEWLARVRDFHDMIERHMREEEDRVFPSFRDELSTEQNARLTAMMNKEGMKLA